MRIQEEMERMIVQELELMTKTNAYYSQIDVNKAKEITKMLTELAVDDRAADTLVNQYIARISNICKTL